MAFETPQQRRARLQAQRQKQAQDWQRIKGWWGRLPRAGSTVADDINGMPALQRSQAEQDAKIARSRAARAAKDAERRRRREAAESAMGDSVADDIAASGVNAPGYAGTLDTSHGWRGFKQTEAGKFPVYPKASPSAQSFRGAFADARKAGKKTFTWQGRKYTTDVA
jgi:hypothetical protein